MLGAAEFFCSVGVMILDVNAGSMTFLRTPDRIGQDLRTFRFVNYGIRPIGRCSAVRRDGRWIGRRCGSVLGTGGRDLPRLLADPAAREAPARPSDGNEVIGSVDPCAPRGRDDLDEAAPR